MRSRPGSRPANSLSNPESLILDGLPGAMRSAWQMEQSRLAKDRLKKLAQAIEALAAKDTILVQKTQEIAALRRQAAMELHAICCTFAAEINRHLSQPTVQFDPSAYSEIGRAHV